jgi:hypothetical protein
MYDDPHLIAGTILTMTTRVDELAAAEAHPGNRDASPPGRRTRKAG